MKAVLTREDCETNSCYEPGALTSYLPRIFALGARPAAIVRLLLSDTVAVTISGIILKLACGIMLSRYLATQLFAVKPTDS